MFSRSFSNKCVFFLPCLNLSGFAESTLRHIGFRGEKYSFFIRILSGKRLLFTWVLSNVISSEMDTIAVVRITKCPFDNLFAKKVLVSYNKIGISQNQW